MHADIFDLETLQFPCVAGCDGWYRSESFRLTVDAMHNAVRQGAGTLLLTGHAGVGKTSLITVLEQNLAPSIHVARFDPKILSVRYDRQQTEEWLQASRFQEIKAECSAWIAQAIRVAPECCSSVLIIVDDAHDLTDHELGGLLRAARLLRSATSAIQVILVGESDFEARLHRDPLMDLVVPVEAMFRLRGLSTKEVGPYIRFAIEAAGRENGDIFTRDAISAIAEHSGGNPRQINNICGAAFLIAGENGDQRVPRASVEECLQDLLVPVRSEQAREHILEETDGRRAQRRVASNNAQIALDLGQPREMRCPGDDRNSPARTTKSFNATHTSLSSIAHTSRMIYRNARHVLRTTWTSLRSVISSTRSRLHASIGKRWRANRSLIWRHLSLRFVHVRARFDRVFAEAARRHRTRPRRNSRRRKQPAAHAMSRREIFAYIKSDKAVIGQFAFAFALFAMAVTVWGLVLSSDGSLTRADRAVASLTTAAASSNHAQPARGNDAADTDLEPALSSVVDGVATHSILAGVELSQEPPSERVAPPDPSPHESIQRRSLSPASAGQSADSEVERTELSRTPALDATREEGTVVVSSKPLIHLETSDPSHPPLSARKAGPATTLAHARHEPREATAHSSPLGALPESRPIERVYTVEAGDTLWSISRSHATNVDALRAANGLSVTTVIHPGQGLIVPVTAKESATAHHWHTVKLGDNLFRIGKRYGVSVTDLQTWNNLVNRTKLVAGQRLRVQAISNDHVAMTEPTKSGDAIPSSATP